MAVQAPMVLAAAAGNRPPPPPGLGRGVLLALLAHGLLVLMLSAGLSWRTQSPPAFEAELWSAVPVAAAPREQLPPPEPPAKVEPKPEPKPAPEPKAQAQAERDAEIALSKEREKKKRDELEAKRKAEQEREAKEMREKQAREAKAREERAKEEKAREKAREQAREEARKAEAREQAQREALRRENLKRIQGMAGASGAPNATGTALKSAGPSSSYAGRIKARIRPNIIYTDSGNANPVAEVEVRVAPDGTILGRKLLKASGDEDWDRAVLRAIDKTETLPRDVDGRVPPLLVIGFQPRE